MSNKALAGSYSDISGSPFMFRNKLINGGFDIWQRNTTQTSSGYGSDDRFQNNHNGSTKTHSRQTFTLGQTDVPGNPTYFSRTIVSSVAGVSNFVFKLQPIESVKTLAGQTATLSFWAKADASKNIAVEFNQFFGTGGSPSSENTGIGVTTCALTTNWKQFTVTINVPSISGKTLGTNNNDYFGVFFWFDAGSTFNSRTNSLGQQSGTFDIANVQLEAGNVATSFEYRPVGLELSLCQRYYEKSFPLDVAPSNGPNATSFSTSSGIVGGLAPYRTGSPEGSYPGYALYRFLIPKRRIASMSSYGNSNGGCFYRTSTGSGAGTGWATNVSFFTTCNNIYGFQVVNEFDGTAGTAFAYFHYAADAEL